MSDPDTPSLVESEPLFSVTPLLVESGPLLSVPPLGGWEMTATVIPIAAARITAVADRKIMRREQQLLLDFGVCLVSSVAKSRLSFMEAFSIDGLPTTVFPVTNIAFLPRASPWLMKTHSGQSGG